MEISTEIITNKVISNKVKKQVHGYRMNSSPISSNSSLVLDKLYIVPAINLIDCNHTRCCETFSETPEQSMHTVENIPAN